MKENVEMKFEALYFPEKLTVVNPTGDVGVITLWSKTESAIGVFKKAGIDLGNDSRIAVIANLYGNGLQQMLRNLLWNPQIRYLVIVGKNLSNSKEWLLNFFEYGIEEIVFLDSKSFRIKNTQRSIDGELLPDQFKKKPEFVIFGDLTDPETTKGVKDFFDKLPQVSSEEYERVKPPAIPELQITRFPSEALAHTIVRRTPMEAWSELIFRLFRFGHRNKVAKKTGEEIRIELLNTHVVILEPFSGTKEELSVFGFDHEHFEGYAKRFLNPEKPIDIDYTYGNRLRGYFSNNGVTVDSLEIVTDRLCASPDSRHCYISLWDNNIDLPEGTKCPCLVSAFFRKFEDQISLTANFRVHNAMDAWPENLYGLMAMQKFVAERVGIPTGPITMISHSISIDPLSLDKAKKVVESKKSDEVFDPKIKKFIPRMDPNGVFTITIDQQSLEIVAEHSFAGMKIGEYRGKTAQEIEIQIARDCAISEISHALYIGRELARKELELKTVAK